MDVSVISEICSGNTGFVKRFILSETQVVAKNSNLYTNRYHGDSMVMKIINLISNSTMAFIVLASVASAENIIVDAGAGSTLTITNAQFKALPRTDLQLNGPNGMILKYSGVDFVQLLMKAEVPTGHALKGRDSDKYVVASGRDGFSAVFSLSELDHGPIVIADELDGLPLSASDGPFRVISPNEGRRSRWVKQLVRISVRKALP